MSAVSDTQAPVDRALADVYRLIVRVRFGGALILSAIAILFAAFGEPAWKPSLAALAGATLIAVSLKSLRAEPDSVGPADVLRILVTVLAAQLVLITLTGGIRSPFVVVSPPLIFGLALGTGSARWTRPGAVFLLSVILLLGLGDVLGGWAPEDLVPTVFRRDDGAAANGYVVASMGAMTLMIVMASILGLLVRRAFQRAMGEALAARAELVEATRERHRELEALTGALAHELKNPLASIRGLASLLARKVPEGSPDAERMDVLLSEIGRMGQILDEFLNFSRPAEGLATSDVSASRLVDEVLALQEPEALHKGVTFERDIGAAVELHVDPRKLKQVLVNLVQNAVEASPAGGVVSVRVAEDATGDMPIVFEVLDQGPGIDPAIASALFTPGATTKPAGTGLGLVIARGIAAQHGGRVTLLNRGVGARGAVARLELPVQARAPRGHG